jgi:hypothetical protein
MDEVKFENCQDYTLEHNDEETAIFYWESRQIEEYANVPLYFDRYIYKLLLDLFEQNCQVYYLKPLVHKFIAKNIKSIPHDYYDRYNVKNDEIYRWSSLKIRIDKLTIDEQNARVELVAYGKMKKDDRLINMFNVNVIFVLLL